MCKKCVGSTYTETDGNQAASPESFDFAKMTSAAPEAAVGSSQAGNNNNDNAADGINGNSGSSKGREMRVCAVCGDVTERRHLNYGGEACFSCRAFFRRIHQVESHFFAKNTKKSSSACDKSSSESASLL